MQAEFMKSALKLEDCPEHKFPEVALLGRSNAGKSSLVNAWTGRKSLAFVSRTPGKTQTLNFFLMEKKFVLADLPGYGFAKRNKQTKEDWAPYIEKYLADRHNLTGAVLIHDVLRDWSDDERNLTNWLDSHELPVVVALNKIDRLNQKERSARLKALAPALADRPYVLISAEKRTGIEDFNRAVFDHLLGRDK